MANKNYKVYMHTNKTNGKIYIGQTFKPVEVRWGKDGIGYKPNAHFWNAIQKYGWDGFTHKVIADNLTKEEADAMEIKLIAKYESQKPNKGYNIQPGGGLGNTGLKFSDESKKKMSDSQKAYWATMTPEERSKNARNQKWNIPVLCIETGEVYQTVQEAADVKGLASKQCITRVLNDMGKKSAKCHWCTLDFAEENAELIEEVKGNPSAYGTWGKVAKIEIVCVETKEVGTLGCFAQSLGIKWIYSLKEVLDNPNKTCGGYHWMTKENYVRDAEQGIKVKPGRRNKGIGVRNISTGEEFTSMAEAVREYGLNYTDFRNYLIKVDKGATNEMFEGYLWEPTGRH